jgi:hypothetical protein
VKLKIIMRLLGLCSFVERDGEYDEAMDVGAFNVLSQLVPDLVMMAIAEYDTAPVAIRRMRVGEDRVKKVRVKHVRQEISYFCSSPYRR